MRDIRLDGVANLRDMGGYCASPGMRVAWGRLFRSGEPTALTSDDRTMIDTLGLRLIYDLRTTGERTKRPSTDWPHGGPRRGHRDYGHSGADLASILDDPATDATRLRELMIGTYQAMPAEQADALASILRSIVDGEIPLLFHCAAGKDRTGMIAAILLDLLGVARTDIAADYLLTNRGLDEARRRFHRRMGRADLDPTTWDPLLRVDIDYLDALFDTIDERHGGTRAYVAALGFSADDISIVRARLLEANA